MYIKNIVRQLDTISPVKNYIKHLQCYNTYAMQCNAKEKVSKMAQFYTQILNSWLTQKMYFLHF